MEDLKQIMPKKLGFGCMRLPVANGNSEEIDDAVFCRMIDRYMEQGQRSDNVRDILIPKEMGELCFTLSGFRSDNRVRVEIGDVPAFVRGGLGVFP